jgi:ATP-dependent helicase/nuclease subunit A
VFLPETTERPNIVRNDVLIKDDLALWKTGADSTPPAMAGVLDAMKEKQSEERMRLLYVAMTRAEKWLIIAAAGKVKEGDASWYNIISDGMMHAGDVVERVGFGDIRRVPHLNWVVGEHITKTVSKKAKIYVPVFGETPIGTRSKTFSPSELKGAKILPGDPGEGDKDAALARGTMYHLLLEHLPLVDPSARQSLGEKLLDGQGDQVFDETLVQEVITLLNTPALAPIFTPDALTEVDVTANLPDLNDARMHGAIDRLIVSDTTVLAIDYKTNRKVPGTPDQVPVGLLRQMGAYHSALKQIFPDHAIETAILWTQTANLMRLPDTLTISALRSVTDT